jgi:DNA mismatch repair protein MutS
MRQYLTIRATHEGCVLLFRMGDFWETFYEDAETLSRVTGLTLTSRGTEKGERVPLAGAPLSTLESIVAKLVEAGHRVAICDQVEDPKQAKGLVRREVVEIVSAGTASFPGLLEDGVSRYLVAIFPDAAAGRVGVTRCDITTGEFRGTEVATETLADELDRTAPSEILLPEGRLPAEVARAAKREVPVQRLPPARFRSAEEARRLLDEGPGLAAPRGQAPLFLPLAMSAAGALLDYLGEMSKAEREELAPLEFDEGEDVLVLDEITLRNLEILRPLRDGWTGSTLLSILDRTHTPMGARRLREWLARPLLSPERIGARLAAVAELVGDAELRGRLAEILDRVGDVARISMRVAAGRAHGRDLSGLADSLDDMPTLRELLASRSAEVFRRLASEISDFSPEVESIREALVDEPPLAIREGGLIRDGHSEEVDRLRSLTRHGKDWIADLQARERERTGIANLKVGYNRVFGYYLEITKANRELVPEDYERRQTLVNAERYVTPELKERESEILGAEERLKATEHDLFVELRGRLAASCPRFRRAAEALGALDTLLSFAEVARREGWAEPVVNDSDRIRIQGGRHPVVEATMGAHEFVPNDTSLEGSRRQIHLITGPNMAGKSTYLRQVALIVLLAQTGSFVPVESAEIGVVDRIFTRVGASDHVAEGHSTFMVEMVEVARILAAASPRSLVLLDEVGRGTATWDGLAIAWAVTEFLHEREERAARTLFATHFHELTELAEKLPRAVNFRITVHEWKDEVVFLRKVVEGAADRSFGIQVARLAGLPSEVTRRAKRILAGLEDGKFLTGREDAGRASGSQLDLFSSAGASVLAELDALNPDQMTPLEALAVLGEWKRRTGEARTEGEEETGAAGEEGAEREEATGAAEEEGAEGEARG